VQVRAAAFSPLAISRVDKFTVFALLSAAKLVLQLLCYKYNTIHHSKTNSAAAFHTIPALNGATHSIFSRKIKYLAQS
jgi:hypothetical protein